MNTARSMLMPSCVPGGRSLLRAAISARTARATSSALAFGCASIPTETPGTRIRARDRALVFRSQLDVRHVGELHEIAIGATTDDEIAEVLRRLEAGGRVQRELARLRLDAPGRDLHVLAVQRRFDVVHRERRAASAVRSIHTRMA